MLPAGLAARDLINESFTSFDTSTWSNMHGATTNPSITSLDAGAGSALALGNRGIWTQFSPTPLAQDFELSLKIAAQAAGERFFYAVVTSAPDTDNKISGYGFRWQVNPGTTAVSNLRFLKLDGVELSSMTASSSGGSLISGSNIASGIAVLSAAPDSSAVFGAIRLTWNSSGALSLYLGDSVAATVTVSDTSFSSFTNLYVSGGQTFYLDQLTLSTISAIPEPGAFALLFGLGSIGLVMLRRRITLLRH